MCDYGGPQFKVEQGRRTVGEGISANKGAFYLAPPHRFLFRCGRMKFPPEKAPRQAVAASVWMTAWLSSLSLL